jgi:hypothetical protein
MNRHTVKVKKDGATVVSTSLEPSGVRLGDILQPKPRKKNG